MLKSSKQIRERLCVAGRKAAEELILIAEAKILEKDTVATTDDLAADKMKNAAAAKKLAIFDAFDILSRVDEEEKKMETEKGKAPEGSKVVVEKVKTDFTSVEKRTA